MSAATCIRCGATVHRTFDGQWTTGYDSHLAITCDGVHLHSVGTVNVTRCLTGTQYDASGEQVAYPVIVPGVYEGHSTGDGYAAVHMDDGRWIELDGGWEVTA